MAVLAAAVMWPLPVRTQDKQADFAKMRELANPGPEHELLAKYAGKGSLNLRYGVGNRAMVFEGSSDNRTMVDGRFLALEYEAESKMGPTSGMLIIGFDRRHGEFTLQAMDSWGTYFVSSRGKREGDAKTVKLYGKDDDPHLKAMGFGEKEFVHVLDFSDDKKLVVEVHMIDTRTEERVERKMMEYAFTPKE